MHFLHSLIQEATDIEIVNIVNYNNNTSVTTSSAVNSKENIHFRNSQSKNNISDKYSLSNKSSKDLGSNKSNSDSDVLQKSHCDHRQNKAFIAIVSFCMLTYA